MTKRTKNALISVVVLAVFAGAYFYISSRPQKENNENKSKSYVLSDKDALDISSVDLVSDVGDLKIVRTTDGWAAEGRKNVMFDTTAVDSFTSDFAALSSTDMIENPKDLAQYGLDKPASTATIKFKDGTTNIFYLGNSTSGRDFYYLMKKGDSNVYLINVGVGERFLTKLEDLRIKNFQYTSLENVNYVYVNQYKAGGSVIEITNKEQKSDKDDALESFGLSYLMMKKPYNGRDVNLLNLNEKLLNNLSNFVIKDFVDDDPSPASLTKYGFDKPSLEVKIKDTENDFDVVFGNDKDADSVYFRLNGLPNVFTMEKSAVTPFLNVDPLDLMDRFIALVNIMKVDEINVSTAIKSYNIKLVHETKKSEKTEDATNADEVVTTYFVDGKEVKEASFKKFYQRLVGLTGDAEVDKYVEKTSPVLTTTFKVNNSAEKINVNYYDFNNDFVAADRDGNMQFVVSRFAIDDMLKSLDDLITGKLDEQ